MNKERIQALLFIGVKSDENAGQQFYSNLSRIGFGKTQPNKKIFSTSKAYGKVEFLLFASLWLPVAYRF